MEVTFGTNTRSAELWTVWTVFGPHRLGLECFLEEYSIRDLESAIQEAEAGLGRRVGPARMEGSGLFSVALAALAALALA